MSEGHALYILNKRKEDCAAIINACVAEINRLIGDIEEQNLVIEQKESQLDDLNKAIEKLEQT
jgi:flagellar hook-associated protein FlgK